jgi:hypothetical protein
LCDDGSGHVELGTNNPLVPFYLGNFRML